MTSGAIPIGTASATTSPVVMPGRRRGHEAWLDQDMLILRTSPLDRDIPVAVIERGEVAGSGGHGFVVVLTAPEDDRPECWTAHGGSAPAAHALRQALPVRDAAEARATGAPLLTGTPVSKPAGADRLDTSPCPSTCGRPQRC